MEYIPEYHNLVDLGLDDEKHGVRTILCADICTFNSGMRDNASDTEQQMAKKEKSVSLSCLFKFDLADESVLLILDRSNIFKSSKP